jgi:hypothetical protein
MLYLGYVPANLPGFYEIMSTDATIVLMLAVLGWEIAISLAIRSLITKKENKDYWCVAKEYKKNEDVPEALPYNKKNFILKWFLYGVGNKISSATKGLTWIKNIVYLSFQIFCTLHLSVFKSFTCGAIGVFGGVVIVLELLVSVPEYLRHKK